MSDEHITDETAPEETGPGRPEPARPQPGDAGFAASRPYDPAGTRPKHRLEDLLPAGAQGLLPGDVVDGDAVEEPWSTFGGGDAPGPPDDAGDDEHLLPVRQPAGSVPATGERGIPPKQSRRIGAIAGALLALAVAGIGVSVLILAGNGHDSKPAPTGVAWSAWRPHGTGEQQVAQIATRVGREYRGSDRKQLVAVTGGPLEAAGLPLTVALREPASQGGNIDLESGTAVLYRLCGLGARCSIATGRPSVKRHLLLRREALELALYTLRYIAVDQVVVFMPPPPGKTANEALFFKRSQLRKQLEQVPLDASLTPQTPTVSSVAKSPDARLVQAITLSTLFKFSLTQANSDTRGFLVLDPLG
ncbi:hypothetical protein NBH00_13240 [Paraconexibacter antarcticus]|uniref:DUF4230 domain-containing protein n=1 Tax=Paraconexibacter antarcticus TaxID=2949664 RepID=A0ABY5DNB3_9ACTN|nr:hypothetical protein [Paraconexibacter antarcticus]UTI62326.1 hypothetical protein NBH00_13240 [Paraconexibacter antarcticus]